jgi:thioesterase domain-containing protein/aryl carrier-like protein
VAPSTPAQELLAGIWAQVLGLDRAGVTDDFFALGGDSLRAVQVVAQIRASGHEITIADFFDNPTIAACARLIPAPGAETGTQPADPQTLSAIPIRRGTAVPPVFCAHSSTGGITEFTEFAAHLAEGQQFYGLQSRGLTSADQPLESVKEMAKAYIEDMITVQPQGPYLIAGWSTGCYIAFEMARQMAAASRHAGGLFLIAPPHQRLGSPLQRRGKRRRRPINRDERRFLRHLDKTIKAGPGQRLLPEYEEELLSMWNLDDEGKAAVRAGDKAKLRAGRIGIINYLAGIHYSGLMQFRLKPYDGRVVLFMPENTSDRMRQGTLGEWLAVLRQQPEIIDVPGEHRTVIYDGAEDVGTWLRAEIIRWEPPASKS